MSDDAEVVALRAEIKAVLDEVVAAERKEAAEIDARVAQENVLGKGVAYGGALGKGLWQGAVGLIEFVGTAAKVAAYVNPLERVNNVLAATYRSYQAGELSKTGWQESLLSRVKDEECKDLASLFGIDPRTITSAQLQQLKLHLVEAYELASFIWDDAPTKQMLLQFGKDYAEAQSSLEMTEVGGGLVFEIVLNALLIVFTGGAGNAANAAGKLRHTGILNKLSAPLKRLGSALKRIRLRKQVPTPTNVPTRVVADLPDGVPLNARSAQSARRAEPPAPTEKSTTAAGENGAGKKTTCDANTCTGGEPISLVTGEEILSLTDFSISGVLPVRWQRLYKSSNSKNTGLGHGWTHPFSERLVVADDRLEYHTHEARVISLPMPDIGGASVNRTEKWRVERLADDYFLVSRSDDPASWMREFSQRLTDGSYPLRSISDAVGNRLACHYENERLQSVSAPHGEQWLLDHNARGQIVAVRAVAMDGKSKTLAIYTYDAANDLVSATDANGNAEHYAYANHLITRRTLKSGYSFHFQWDGHTNAARCIRNWGDPIQGRPTYDYRFAWDASNRKVSVTDTRGGVEHYQFNEAGLPIYRRNPEGGETIWSYDRQNNVIDETDPLGQKRIYTYDDQDRLITVVDSDGAQTQIEYNAFGNAATVIDATGQSWKREYNLLGQLIKQSNPLGESFRYQHNAQGQVSAVINPLNAAWHYVWNHQAQLVAIRDPSGLHTRYEYDNEKNLVAIVWPDKTRTEYAYDAAGQCTLIKTPDGRSQQFEYNALGLLTQQRDQSGRTTQYHYDGLSQVVKRIDPMGHALHYHYDGERNLVGLINENGERYSLTYDLNERLIEEAGFDGRLQRYQYNAAGHLIGSSAFESDSKTLHTQLRYVRNVRGQLLEQWVDKMPSRPPQPKKLAQFEYDPLGRMVSAENSHRPLRWAYDPAGRVVEDHQGDTVLRHGYDAVGRRIATELPNGSLLRYDYAAGAGLDAVSVDGLELLRVHRDDYGRETARDLGQQLTTRSSYDPQGRLQRQRTQKRSSGLPHAANLFQRSYHYDSNGQISRIDDSQRGSVHYRYDASDRLIGVDGPDPETFVHDPAGNLLTQSDDEGAVDRGNRLTFHGDSHYHYDAQGNRISRRRGKGQQQETLYTYDALNQLAAVRANGEETRYTYDALGRRIGKESAQQTTEFLWLDDVLLSETSTPCEGMVTSRTYLFEPFSFRPLAFIENQQLYFYHLDHLGTPQEITDHRGAIVWSGRYRAYGSLAAAPIRSVENHLRFQGQYCDEESGLHYNRFRYYDPVVGSFINQDPIGLAGGLNDYQYVPNPVRWIDPWGLTAKDCGQGRSGALNEAKRDLGIPRSQNPDEISRVPMTDRNGRSILDKNGKPIMTREYTYTRADGSKVIIQDHSAGHQFGQGGVGDQGSHFNVRPPENTRTGSVPGAKDHYSW